MQLTDVIWIDTLRPVVGLDHPLAKEQIVALEELLTFPAVLPTSGTYTRTILEQRIAGNHQQLNCTLSTDHLETLKMTVSIGLGWSLLPEILLDEQLKPLAIPELGLYRSLGIVTHRKRTLSNATGTTRTLLQNESDPSQPAKPMATIAYEINDLLERRSLCVTCNPGLILELSAP
jgi:DNA-binding transcriptional LysR family regulator